MIFSDQHGVTLTMDQWWTQQQNQHYRVRAFDRVGQWLILTEWTGINGPLFRTRVFSLSTEQEGKEIYTPNLEHATIQHQRSIKICIQQDPEYSSQAAKEICVLCGSAMKPSTGKFGGFFSCTAWSETECPCTVSKNGKLSRSTRDVLKQMALDKQYQEEKDAFEDRLDQLELD